MDIRALHIFTRLARTLHFGRASRDCGLSPSALTSTVQRIEEELGVRLFVRDNRRVSLTAAGLVFQRYAEEAQQRWQALQRELAGSAGLRGELSLYCSVTAAQSLLPRILAAFRDSHPEVRITLQTGDAAEAISKLRGREAEVTIAALPDDLPPAIEFIVLAETPLVFLGPVQFADTIVYRDGAIDWQRTPLITAERGLSRERVDRWFQDKGVQANIYARVAGNEALLTMVSLGCGVGVAPRLVLEKSTLQDQLRVLDVRPRLAPFIIGACTFKKNLDNPLVAAFWATVGRQTAQGGA